MARAGAIIGTMILHLHLVRHGQTVFNRYNRLQGWCDSPLTESGLADADKAGRKLADIDFAAAYCSDTSRARITAARILDVNEAAGHRRPALVDDMHFREQCYGYFEGQDMSLAWTAAGGPHGAPSYNAIVARYGLSATRDLLKAADPFHDAESDAEYWARVEGAFALIAANPTLRDGDHVLQISHGNTLLSLAHRFGGDGLDLSERPANGSVTVVDFDTERPFENALTIVSYNG
ncbi:fructose-2,6-bisphosphatase [Bifidobacterium samirii]|uniref:Fructose-2,6-bisphosphatase n=2 Tax=Bifidobacterium samirii TaxID=2306974 RepID=A0A430FU87_9BIFI|nr:fructose-2,6-bisphosphatase [Bifidobacterium samirii]